MKSSFWVMVLFLVLCSYSQAQPSVNLSRDQQLQFCQLLIENNVVFRQNPAPKDDVVLVDRRASCEQTLYVLHTQGATAWEYFFEPKFAVIVPGAPEAPNTEHYGYLVSIGAPSLQNPSLIWGRLDPEQWRFEAWQGEPLDTRRINASEPLTRVQSIMTSARVPKRYSDSMVTGVTRIYPILFRALTAFAAGNTELARTTLRSIPLNPCQR